MMNKVYFSNDQKRVISRASNSRTTPRRLLMTRGIVADAPGAAGAQLTASRLALRSRFAPDLVGRGSGPAAEGAMEAWRRGEAQPRCDLGDGS
jgi:hypothetical protein